MVVAVIAAAALLLAFNRVVRQAVQQGALRHATERAQNDALWRCKAMQSRQARADCRPGAV